MTSNTEQNFQPLSLWDRIWLIISNTCAYSFLGGVSSLCLFILAYYINDPNDPAGWEYFGGVILAVPAGLIAGPIFSWLCVLVDFLINEHNLQVSTRYGWMGTLLAGLPYSIYFFMQ